MSFAQSFNSELQSSPSSMAVAFSGASAADHLVTAKHSLTSNIDNNPNFASELQSARETLEMAQDGIALRHAELGAIEETHEEPSLGRKIGAETGAAIASTPVEIALATAADAFVPGAGTMAMTLFKAQQAASMASIAHEAISSPQSGSVNKSEGYFANDDEFDMSEYVAYSDEVNVMTPTQQPAMAMPREPQGPALFWKDPLSSDPVMDALAKQHQYASSMISDIAELQDRKLELNAPKPAAFA